MITGVHTLLYSSDYEATRAFMRDVLRLPNVDTGGWLIFKTGPSESASHPNSWEGPDAGRTDQLFDVSFMCDDLETTMAELAERGAEFDGGPVEQPWGRVIRVQVPGTSPISVYQPNYPPVASADI